MIVLLVYPLSVEVLEDYNSKVFFDCDITVIDAKPVLERELNF